MMRTDDDDEPDWYKMKKDIICKKPVYKRTAIMRDYMDDNDPYNRFVDNGKNDEELTKTKVRIVSIHHRDVNLLNVQYESIKYFLMDENVEYVIVIASVDLEKRNELYNKCMEFGKKEEEEKKKYLGEKKKSLNIQCEIVENDVILNYHFKTTKNVKYIQNKHYNVLSYAKKKYMETVKGYVLNIDSDVYFWKHFSVVRFIEKYDIDISGYFTHVDVTKHKKIVSYPHCSLMLFNTINLPNFESYGLKNQVYDTCGQGYLYLNEHYGKINVFDSPIIYRAGEYHGDFVDIENKFGITDINQSTRNLFICDSAIFLKYNIYKDYIGFCRKGKPYGSNSLLIYHIPVVHIQNVASLDYKDIPIVFLKKKIILHSLYMKFIIEKEKGNIPKDSIFNCLSFI